MDMASVSLTFSSSIVPSPIPQHRCNKTHNKVPIFRLIRCAVSPPPSKTASNSSPVVKKKHWKQGEFPGFSETPGTRRKPIKNIKKKLDRKNDAKAWVSTVTEALSERIDKKQWLQALEVLSLLSNSLLYYVSLFKI
jgi:hypothetical protein